MTEEIFLANMSFNGFSDWLKVVMRTDKKGEKYIVFCRDKNNIHAWHCNSLPITDSKILKIKPMTV